ncbi:MULTISPECIES: FtsX-like permease family protein [Clostridium]|uniref:Similar to ABC transporter (Permease) n=1 Tax=Clostridium acetobutylicum (strain ATCC 824 / DSM 792 / JCM 1419 / IAM 19013 / LMG 5710 / NBRC 13948 / NRRL B-527 / VKM B-1787 / 2291 / W) TaxID=272562 RepID=Q97M26_CLOAB|nr:MULTISPECIES: FtsX-like permease family protein [Clostridium]AAK78354.1 Similar to ABC transporter (permease) [Clostridium acetobutylicum ATCC 824]AWV80078.1 ABC transporter permease [Clostridium acetobutylicum]PSM05880.1 ABC transporter permease [Clostridium sp. NJ4]TQD49524.1 FtsX-like permease family protein [Clostridium acetobutylicum]
MKYKKVLSNSLKINFFSYVGFIISSSFAIMITFIYSTVTLSTHMPQNNGRTFINYVVKLSIICIIICIGIFITYSYNNYIKWRTDEFKALILIGVTKVELRRLLIMESFILVSVAFIIGASLGIVFSKIFFLSIIKLCGLRNVAFQITYKNYVNVISLFLWMLALMLYRSYKISSFLDAKRLLKYKGTPILMKHENRKLRIFILIVLGCILYKKMSKGFSQNMEFYMTNIFISVFLAYLSSSPFMWIVRKVVKKSKNNIYMQMKSVKSMFEMDKKLTFLLSVMSFIIISYVRINYYTYDTGYQGMSNVFAANKGYFVTFIYVFTILLCFIIFSSIIFCKTSFDIRSVKRLYYKMFIIGITQNEFKRFIRLKLFIIFFKPLILSLFMSVVYIEISNLKFNFSFGTAFIYLVYFISLLIGYFGAEKKYKKEVFNSKGMAI